MASTSILRVSHGARCLLIRPQLYSQTLPSLVQTQVDKKQFSLSPALRIDHMKFKKMAPDFIRARRGPFTAEEKRGDHKIMASTHWKIERVLAVAMVGVMPAALFVQGPVMDFLLSTSVLLHGFWGVDGVLTDYLEKFVPFIHYPWYLITILGLAGLLYFNYNDVGVCKAIEMVWHFEKKEK